MLPHRFAQAPESKTQPTVRFGGKSWQHVAVATILPSCLLTYHFGHYYYDYWPSRAMRKAINSLPQKLTNRNAIMQAVNPPRSRLHSGSIIISAGILANIKLLKRKIHCCFSDSHVDRVGMLLCIKESMNWHIRKRVSY